MALCCCRGRAFDMYAVCLTLVVYLGFVHGNCKLAVGHTNDMHARLQQASRSLGICDNDNDTACYGGFARIHSDVVHLKQIAASRGLPMIFLNAGDTFQGTPYFTYFKWPIMAKFVNLLGLDVMSLGNHEFDTGVPSLAQYIANLSVPNVCCNLNISLEPSLNQPNLTPSKVLNISGTLIGIIGYLTPDTKNLSNTGKLVIKDEIISIRAEAEKLHSQGVKILIALGHSGYDKDKQIGREVEGIDLVVGGHSHTFLYTGMPPDEEIPAGPYPTVVIQPSGKKVPVVQAFYGTKYLGYLELEFDDSGNLISFEGSPILLSGNMTQDPKILAELRPYEDKISSIIRRIVGYTKVLLDSSNSKCRLGECNLGNLIADAYVDYVAAHYNSSQGWTIAAIAVIQAGGIRASINTQTNANHNGSITLGDVITVIPWGSKVIVLNITGSDLLKALEFSVARYEETKTGHVSEFLQVSGLRVVYNINQTKGHRVVSVDVRCADCDVPEYQPLQLDQKYGVVIPEYIQSGGDGFSMFESYEPLKVLDDVDYDIVGEYIESHSPVNPEIEGRITIKQGPKSSAAHLTSSYVIWFTLAFILTAKATFNSNL